jgi:hypothetical protein
MNPGGAGRRRTWRVDFERVVACVKATDFVTSVAMAAMGGRMTVTSQKVVARTLCFVIPAQAGIQKVQQKQPVLDPRFRGGDDDFSASPRLLEKLRMTRATYCFR